MKNTYLQLSISNQVKFFRWFGLFTLLFVFGIKANGQSGNDNPDPESNPTSSFMLSGDWFGHPHQIDVDELPKVPKEHTIINNVTDEDGVNQHNYLIHFDGLFWAMWSDGPGIEDRVGQVVKYATSQDGLHWSSSKMLTPYPPNSSPDSEFYNTRTKEGLRWIARGFWVYEGELLALASLDEAAGFFGPGLELHAFKWDNGMKRWQDEGLVANNSINNFPPKMLPNGLWLMSRRTYDYKDKGVDFLVGGKNGFNSWNSYPVLGTNAELEAEEPYWWILPDGRNLMALFRDNRKSGYLYRSFSTDNGRTWSVPVQTNFPDARSKFHGMRMSNGDYVLVSNSHPENRDYLTLALSKDGMVFDSCFSLWKVKLAVWIIPWSWSMTGIYILSIRVE